MSARPNVKVRRLVRNKSSRNGARPQLIVLHSTEGSNVKGLGDLVGLGGFFDRPAVQASSHVATDAEGNSARYVRDSDKAWTQAHYNPVSLSIEQVGAAAQKSWSLAQRQETARWIAYWSKKHGIPIRKAIVSNGRVVRSGVIRHSELGSLGGNHHDPGRGFDLHYVLERARKYRRQL
jgi:hypothetical protein